MRALGKGWARLPDLNTKRICTFAMTDQRSLAMRSYNDGDRASGFAGPTTSAAFMGIRSAGLGEGASRSASAKYALLRFT